MHSVTIAVGVVFLLRLIRVESLPRADHTKVVGMGEMAFVKPPWKAATYALGSCVAIVLYSAASREGVLIHAVLPSPCSRGPDSPARYVSTSIPYALRRLRSSHGGVIVAALVGGAKVINAGPPINVGMRNVEAAKRLLLSEGIPIVAEDVGGTVSRSVLFDPLKQVVYVASRSWAKRDLARVLL